MSNVSHFLRMHVLSARTGNGVPSTQHSCCAPNTTDDIDTSFFRSSTITDWRWNDKSLPSRDISMKRSAKLEHKPQSSSGVREDIADPVYGMYSDIPNMLVNSFTSQDKFIIEAINLYERGILCQSSGDIWMAREFFEKAAYFIEHTNCYTDRKASAVVMEFAMRIHKNLGLIYCMEAKYDIAAASYDVALMFGKHLAVLSKNLRLEYASIMSNWCRVKGLRGDISDALLYNRLKEVFEIYSECLSWDHPEAAAALFKVAVAEYSKKNNEKSASYFTQYMTIANHRTNVLKVHDVDPFPAMLFLLIMQNESKGDVISHNLVCALRSLQILIQTVEADTLEVASLLNIIGSLLFQQKDFENALIFYQKELVYEESLVQAKDSSTTWEQSTAICVTCNNIGRILQEMGRYQEAVEYYERVLTLEFGNIKDVSLSSISISRFGQETIGVANTSRIPLATANLYSTVWYNLGLVQDKLGGYDDAIKSFQASLKLRQELLGPDHPDVACLTYNIGVLQMEQQQLDEASISLRQTIRIRRSNGEGQLSDSHMIKALDRLASLHETKGNFIESIEILNEIIAIQRTSNEFDKVSRSKKLGKSLRSLSELLLAMNNLPQAIHAASESFQYHRYVIDSESLFPNEGHDVILDHVSNVEQLISTLLLLGSLYHESCEPIHAEQIFKEAARVAKTASMALDKHPFYDKPTSLLAMEEVTTMLGAGCSAPQA